MSKKATVQPEVVSFEIPMALAPIPGDVDKREFNENKITSAAKAAMNGGAPLKGPISITLSMSYPPGASMRRSHTWRVTAPTTSVHSGPSSDPRRRSRDPHGWTKERVDPPGKGR